MQTEEEEEELDLWQEFMTADNQTSSPLSKEMRRYFGVEEDEDVALTEIRSVLQKIESCNNKIESIYGLSFQVSLGSRVFVIHIPPSLQQCSATQRRNKYSVLFFFHGLMGSAWQSALYTTKWIEHSEERDCIIVFGQAKGKIFPQPIREKWGCLAVGDTEWGVREPKEDVKYILDIVDWLKNTYGELIDDSKMYYMGYSNGAMFASNVAIYIGGKVFKRIVNAMGGWGGGYKEETIKADIKDMVTPVQGMLILTGETDPYLNSCKRAKEIFENAHVVVKFEIIPGYGHSYPTHKEQEIWNYLVTY